MMKHALALSIKTHVAYQHYMYGQEPQPAIVSANNNQTVCAVQMQEMPLVIVRIILIVVIKKITIGLIADVNAKK